MTKDEGAVTSSSQSTSEMNSPEQTPGASKAPSKAQSIDEERPSGPLRRDSLASLSVAREPCGWVEPEEPTWPSGWKPYACLFGGFLLMFNSWGIVNAYGSYASYYMQHLLPGRDILLLNLVGATQSSIVLFLSAPVGRFLDAGHIRKLLIIGTVLLTIASYVLSTVNGQGDFGQGNYGLIWLTQGLLSGLGMACFFVSSSQVVATWFKKKKGFAIGVVASGASIAGLVYPVMLKFLISSEGFNNAQRYVSTLTTATCILTIFIARPNPEHIVRKPEKWRFGVFIDMHAFQNQAFNWMTASICFLFFGFYAVFFNLEEWAAREGLGYRDSTPSGFNIGLENEVHHDAIRTFYLLAIMNGSSTLGRLSSSYLCDLFGALNVHAVVTFVASMLCLVLWTLAKTVPAAIAFVVTFGVFSGAVIGLPPASMAYLLGPNPEAQARLGQWTGMMYSAAGIFALTGPLIAGHLISAYGNNFLTVQLWSGACMMLSAGCMAIAIIYRHHDSARGWASQKAQRLNASIDSTASALTRMTTGETEKQDV
ncbi:MFS general substrate transporter [Hortaea werneckii]|nr:MFS general substrate transporter [Hortaea werneckii]KAI7318644.1 MFS general substrate transporter [Hortaea werneckii]